MVTVRSLLNGARVSKGWSIQTLAERSKVKTERSNLRRKLADLGEGDRRIALDPREVQQLARALEVDIPDEVLQRDLMAGRVARCVAANRPPDHRARRHGGAP